MAQELNIRLDTGCSTPLYRQIYDYIRDEIRSGGLQAGERLPSTRALAENLHVARSTVEFAYGQLLSEGYIRAKRNSGYFVDDNENLVDMHLTGADRPENAPPEKETAGQAFAQTAGETFARAAGRDPARLAKENFARTAGEVFAREDIIDFSPRHTEMSFFPYSTWKRIMREVMVKADPEMFSLGEPRGEFSLRSTIVRYLHFSRGVCCTPDQVIVGAGNDYLFMLLRHILGEGRTVAMENPTYLRAAQIFRSFGYRLSFVDMDEEGMLPESVRRSEADLVYTMPAHQFPVGCVMPVARRAALLRWAAEAGDRYIIEDDYDSEFRFRGKPIPSLQSLDTSGHVIYMGTFSKAIAPAIRVSYMILPPSLLGSYRQNCHFFSSTVSRIDQRILDEFMKNGHFERYLNKMRNIYRIRHDELIDQLAPFRDRFRIRGAGTGLHVVLEALPGASLPGGTACGSGPDPVSLEQDLVRRALLQGVHVYGLSGFYVPPAAGESGPAGIPGGMENYCPALLLGFGALDPGRIREGVRRMAEAWKQEALSAYEK